MASVSKKLEEAQKLNPNGTGTIPPVKPMRPSVPTKEDIKESRLSIKPQTPGNLKPQNASVFVN